MLTKKLQNDSWDSSQGFLSWNKDNHVEQREVGNFLSLGRGETNQIILDDSFASRHHVRIERHPDEGFFILKDMKSRNGVLLNGNRVYQAVLSHNDQIQIGKTKFSFSFERFNKNWNLLTQSLNSDWNKELSRVPSLSKSDYPVLLLGPSGTGKEVLSKVIHKYSSRREGPLVSINCSALTESLIESELFGHVKGSYTGAISSRKGAFLAAKGGTLFLDEIGDLPLSLQPKLLRAIEYQEVKPVGSDQTLKTDVRIIAATHQNLKQKITEKEFREDLYYRLNVIKMTLPALKERPEDIELFINHFASRHGVVLSSKAISVFCSYSWPGNIRELKNTMARAKALFVSDIIDDKKASLVLDQGEELKNNEEETGSVTLNEVEKAMITKLLRKHRGHQKNVATEMGIPASTLHDKLKKHSIKPKNFKVF